MGDSTLKMQGDDGGQLERAIRALAGARGNIPADSKQIIRDLAESLAKRASKAVLAEPTHGDKHTGLREVISRGVAVVDVEGGAMIITTVPKSDEAIIPRGFDTAVGGKWRHPLFGNKAKWYDNRGAFSWFMGSMASGLSDGRDKLIAMLEQAAEAVARET